MTTPTPQDYALEPCPFCGGADIFIEPDERGSGGQWVGPVHVGCKACGCQLCADDESKAVAWWNRRAPQSGWLPISEAPRDGTEIILRRGNRVTAGHWMSEVEVLGPEYHSNGTYLGQFPTGEVREACWLSWDGGFTEEEPPTHWQPLPIPPSTKGEPPDADLWYLQDTRSYVGNDVLWWAKDGKGYTTDLSKAHVYSRDEAFRQAAMRGTDRAWPKAYIDGKTRPAVDMQYIKHAEAMATKGESTNG